MRRSLAAVTGIVVVGLAGGAIGCSPRLHVGMDSQTTTTGPLSNLQAQPRLAALDEVRAAPPEGRNMSLGIGYGDRDFQLGLGLRGNGVSGSTLEVGGSRYVSAAASLDFRYHFLRYKWMSAGIKLAPTRTLLFDTMSGERHWGSGVTYGGGGALTLGAVQVYADVYEERIVFGDGPATGVSTRQGVTIGLAFQP